MVVPENYSEKLFSGDCDENLYSEDYNMPILLGEGNKSIIDSFFSGDSSENIFAGVVYESIFNESVYESIYIGSVIEDGSSRRAFTTKSGVADTRHNSLMEGRRCGTLGCCNPAKLQCPASSSTSR